MHLITLEMMIRQPKSLEESVLQRSPKTFGPMNIEIVKFVMVDVEYPPELQAKLHYIRKAWETVQQMHSYDELVEGWGLEPAEKVLSWKEIWMLMVVHWKSRTSNRENNH